MRSAFALALVATLASSALAEPERYTLDNGAVVVLDPVEGADAIAMIAAYDTGYADDPAGLCQGAHLVEHLRVTDATASFAPGESHTRLNELGGANAETLADMTYYDYALPADQLELALQIEQERLSSLRTTPGDIARETPRVAAEVQSVTTAPTRPLGKFALMACMQGWRHDSTSVRVRSGLEDTTPDQLAGLLARSNPASLTLLITGGFDPDNVKAMIERTIGAVPGSQAPDRPTIDWAAQPATRRIEWDVPARAIAIACPPPDDELGRSLMTPLGMIATLGVQSIPGVLSMHPSGLTAPVGATPFHVLVVLDDDADEDAVIAQLQERLDNALHNASLYRSQAPAMLRMLTPTDPAVLREHAKSMATYRGMDELTTYATILGNAALQRHLRERLGGEETADRIHALSGDQFAEIVGRTLARENRRVTILGPASD